MQCAHPPLYMGKQLCDARHNLLSINLNKVDDILLLCVIMLCMVNRLASPPGHSQFFYDLRVFRGDLQKQRNLISSKVSRCIVGNF